MPYRGEKEKTIGTSALRDFSFFHKTLDREILRQREIMHVRPLPIIGCFLHRLVFSTNIKLDLHFPGTNFLVVWSEGDSWSESSPVKPVRQFWIKSLYPIWSIALTVDGKIKVILQLWNVGRMFVARRCSIMIEAIKRNISRELFLYII